MLEFCETLTVPVSLLTPMGHEYDGGLEDMLVERIIFNADICRITAVEMQVLK